MKRGTGTILSKLQTSKLDVSNYIFTHKSNFQNAHEFDLQIKLQNDHH